MQATPINRLRISPALTLDEVYMRKRIHSSLDYLTLAEFESQWRAQQKIAAQTHFHQ